MKKILLITATFCTLVATAQVKQKISSSDIYRTRSENSGRGSSALGTPYLDDQFALAEVEGVSDLVLVKYNAQHDHFDIDSGDGKIYTLPKSADMGAVKYRNGKYTFVYEQYTNLKGVQESGYLIEKFNSNGIGLYKKQRIILLAAKSAASSYEQDTPAKLIKANEEYYIKTKDQKIVGVPTNKKKMLELFPQQKTQITSFMKEKKISLKDESDLVQLATYIATL